MRTALGLLMPVALLAAGQAALGAGRAPVVFRAGHVLQVATGTLQVGCDLNTGRWGCQWHNACSLRGGFCAAILANGTSLDSSTSTKHECGPADVRPVLDAFGRGIMLTVHHRQPGEPEVRQRWWIYAGQPFVITQVQVVAHGPVSSNNISPLVIDSTRFPGSGLRLDIHSRPRTLFVPFDNDSWVRYNSDYSSDSYEVTSVYDNASRHGFVIGSVSHNLWKTRLTNASSGPGVIGQFRAYGGGTGVWTHDSQPHGMVTGTTVSSPRLFIGCFQDWRAGMETYGRANARFQPPLAWAGGPPFGWNSWFAYETHVDAGRCSEVSDFIHSQLQPAGFSDRGVVYVNLDSFWSNFPEDRLEALVRQIHANGQKAGIYWTPFTAWGDDQARVVEGTGNRYHYGDILLKDAAGKLLPKLDGGWPIDPTHPGELQRIDWNLARFVRWGFDYVKLDFLSHGTLEGHHFDPAITTGIAAYNLGMKRIVQDLAFARIGRPFFISLSIAPLFPAGYGHSRRISCDAAGSIKNSEYMLNSVTYGWWIAGTLYPFNDPDMVALKDSPAEARTRIDAAVVADGMLLDSDDLASPGPQQRAKDLLTNPAILAVAREGRTFLPVEGDTGAHAADLFVRREPAGRFLLAFFNFGPAAVTHTVALARAGLPAVRYQVQDLWSGARSSARGNLSVPLLGAQSTILELTPAPG